MAKGKHSVALFEVIQAGKSSSRASSLRTPKWWFKAKKAEPETAAPAPPVVVEESTAPAPRNPGVDLKLDPDRQRIKFDVTYTSALVAAFTVVVVVGLAYVIGSHMTSGPAAALAGPSTEQIRKAPAQPGVLKVGSGAPAIIPPIEPSPKIDRTETITTPPVTPRTPAPAQTQAPPQLQGRAAGLNYTIMQSFPPAEKAMAFEVSEYLNGNGVRSTVETNVAGYSGWFVVMGMDGFQRPSRDPAYKEYEKKIRELSDKFAKEKSAKNARFKRFDQPSAKQWQGTEKTAAAG